MGSNLLKGFNQSNTTLYIHRKFAIHVKDKQTTEIDWLKAASTTTAYPWLSIVYSLNTYDEKANYKNASNMEVRNKIDR